MAPSEDAKLRRAFLREVLEVIAARPAHQLAWLEEESMKCWGVSGGLLPLEEIVESLLDCFDNARNHLVDIGAITTQESAEINALGSTISAMLRDKDESMWSAPESLATHANWQVLRDKASSLLHLLSETDDRGVLGF